MNENSRDSVAFKTPIGDMSIIYRGNPFKISRIFLPGNNKTNNSSITLSGDSSKNCRIHEKVKEIVNLICYGIRGQSFTISWDWFLWEGVTGLQKAVYKETAMIPFGSLSTYKKIARRIGRPKACRFVGTALAKNPFPVLIPCHRVIRSDNKIGGFGGGPRLKQLLINAEVSDRLLHI